ncbi:MAG TPA: HEAT repeat domain-containing protein [Planctomycetota bacterium]|nr:HEAT repeat domain-containing protein [Planctomycetota bacterium]
MRGLIGGGIGFAAGLVVAMFVETRPIARTDRSLERELRDAKARTRELEVELEQLRAQAPGDTSEETPAEPSAAAARANESPDSEIPAALSDAAAALRVPDDALRAALDAYHDGSAAKIARLKRCGADGFRALVAMVKASRLSTPDFFMMVWDPSLAGEEAALIDVANGSDFGQASIALLALGRCDTPRSREYLLERLRSDTEGRFLQSCATSLRRMREASALPDLARSIRNRYVPTPQRATAVYAIGSIGGGDAASILTDYLREADADLLVEAVVALARLDRAAARREARLASLRPAPRPARRGHT